MPLKVPSARFRVPSANVYITYIYYVQNLFEYIIIAFRVEPGTWNPEPIYFFEIIDGIIFYNFLKQNLNFLRIKLCSELFY
jgi:hypothetical protein